MSITRRVKSELECRISLVNIRHTAVDGWLLLPNHKEF